MDIRKIIKDLLELAALPKGEGLVGFTEEQLKQARDTAREIAFYAKESRNKEDLVAAVEAFEAISAELTSRVEKAAKTDKEIADLAARITVSDPEPEPDPEPAPEPVAPEATPAPEPEVVPAPTAVVEPVPVAAAVTPAPVTPAPEPTPTPAPAPTPAPVPEPTIRPATPDEEALITLVAAGDVAHYSTGQAMKVEDVAQAMTDKADAMHLTGGNGRLSVGRMSWSYPEDRTLGKDADANTRKINAVIAAAQAETRENLNKIMWARDPNELESLVAAGGLCAPVNVRYELFTVGTTARPLRDSLTRFGANRGGIRFNAPPTLADLRDSDAVNIYTEAQDASGADYPKGCIRVDCGDDVEVAVSAITLCMVAGNYIKLFNPENPAAWWGLGRVQHARIAEAAIWDRIDTLSTNVLAGEGLGAAPDTLSQVEKAAAQYRDRHRIDPETPLRLRAPAFLRSIMRVDLARRAPGDNTLAVSNAEIARYFAASNIAVTWVLDGQYASGTSQYNQAAGAINPWPSSVDVSLSIDGTFLFLDGGSLDFGTEIRDFDMIKANDVGMFMEDFENTAFVGPEAIMLSLNICPDGSTGAPNSSFDPCTSGS